MTEKSQALRELFGRNLKQYRKLRGLTQDDLADSLGIKRNTISNYETGASYPDPATVDGIVKILGVSHDDLMSSSRYLPDSQDELSNMVSEPMAKYGMDAMNVIELLDLLENQCSNKVLVSKIKSQVLQLLTNVNEEKERVIKLHEKLDAVKDLLIRSGIKV